MAARPSRRTLAALATCLAVIGTAGLAASGQALQTARVASGCRSRYPEVPCLGPIQSEYGFPGVGYGAVGYIGAKVGAEEPTGTTTPAPGNHPVYRRIFTLHTGHGTEFVAAFILHGGNHGHYQYQRVFPVHGKLTLRGGREVRKLILLLEGRRPAHASAQAASSCYVAEVPCLGRLEALYPFSGRDGGAIHSFHVTLGPEEEAGTDAEGPILHRSFTWRSIASVEIVAAFILSVHVEHGKAVREDGRYKWLTRRVPTGTHSGRVTLTTDQPSNGNQPFLLLEGRKT